MSLDLSTKDPVIIGLTGLAGTGKTEAATYLEERHGFVAVAFADPLKDMIEAHLTDRGVDYRWLYEHGLKEQPIPGLGVSARQLMQTLGDCMRSLSPSWWIDSLADRIGLRPPLAADWVPVHDRIVVSDVRYPNELEWLRSRGGALIRLHRPQAARVREHSSESYVSVMAADIDLVNDGPSVRGFHQLLDGALDSLGVRT